MKTVFQELISDRPFWLALVAGPAFWVALGLAMQPHFLPAWPLARPMDFVSVSLLYPVVEEIVFRGLLQGWLAERLRCRAWRGLSAANIATSVSFTALHFFYHPPLYAASVFIPSLIFGYFRERHDDLTAPIALHVWYNAGYFWIFG